MTDHVRGIMERLCAGKADGDWVFTRPDGDHAVDFRKNWDRAIEFIKHPELIFHDLRRTGACRMIEMGIPERTVMLIAGWETETMLRRYLKARGVRDKSDAIAIMNAVRKGLPKPHAIVHAIFGSSEVPPSTSSVQEVQIV